MTLNKNKKLLLGLSIATIFALGLVSYSSVAYAGGAVPGTADPADTTDDVSANLVTVGPVPFAQYDFGSKSISLYFGVDTQIFDRPTVINIAGFTVDAAPTAKFTLIEADAQQNTLASINNPVTFNGAFQGDLLGADGPAISFWDTFTRNVSGDVSGGDTSAVITIDSDGSTTDCLVAQGVVFEEGSGQPAGYVADGVALRDLASATIVIAGIPANHVPVAAHLFWNVLNPNDPGSQIDINGITITADQAGTDTPDPCWAQVITWGFEANVTTEIVGNGNGNYIIDNLPGVLMEGATLVVIHEGTIDATKTWTETDYNWDEICNEIEIQGVIQLVCRPANINNPADDVLADSLDPDGDGTSDVVLQVKNNGNISNMNPGAIYALTTVEINTDLDMLEVEEEYEDCTSTLLELLNQKKLTRNVKVAVAAPNGDIEELTERLYDTDDDGVEFTKVPDDTSTKVKINDASLLTDGSTVYVLVKFDDQLKNVSFQSLDDLDCDNIEWVTASIGQDEFERHAEATLRFTQAP